MRRARDQPDTTPCSSLALGLMCMIMVSLQPGLIVTVLVSESVWRRYDRIFGFGATPPRRHGTVIARVFSPLVPSCIAPCVCTTELGGSSIGRPGDVGPQGHPSFVGRIFRACANPRSSPVLHPSCHVLHHTKPESGKAPGPPAGPGWILSHRSSLFPSFGVPHPGISNNTWLPFPPPRTAAPLLRLIL